MKKANLLTITAIDSDPKFLYGVTYRALGEDGKETTHTKHAVANIGHERHRKTRDGITTQIVADAMANATGGHCAPGTWRFEGEAGHLFGESVLWTVPGRQGAPKEVTAEKLAGVEIDPKTGAPHLSIEVLDEDGEMRPFKDRVTGRPAGAKLVRRYAVSINLLTPLASAFEAGVTALVCTLGEHLVLKQEKADRLQAKLDRRAAKRDGTATEDKANACARYFERGPGEWVCEPVHSAGKATAGIEAETFTGPDAEAQAAAAASAIEALFSA